MVNSLRIENKQQIAKRFTLKILAAKKNMKEKKGFEKKFRQTSTFSSEYISSMFYNSVHQIQGQRAIQGRGGCNDVIMTEL